ncbi:MAG: hypothetical protein ACI8Z7_000748 [Candidatus Nanohaloarchaea archaeon]|jgi:uncharacterized protein (DUF305 family)
MNITERNRKILFAGIAVLILAATASFGMFGMPNQPSDQVSEFNRADLMFMNMMIIHHDQAIEMAELAENRTDNENILELSENISQAQTRENQKMSEWLREAGFNRPTRGHRMAGMATQQEMNELRQSDGREFDLLFSELMTEHHEGGIQMARAEVQNGKSEKVVELAQRMIYVQQEEVEKMETWKTEWTNS